MNIKGGDLMRAQTKFIKIKINKIFISLNKNFNK
jgi:hypothetical protein